ISSPKDENDLVRPAVEGTLRALRAAHGAGVKRVILTSSVAAIYGTDLPDGKTEFDESVWSDPNHVIGRVAYTKSKTLAEKAAWDYIAAEAPEIELTTVNPVLVAGVGIGLWSAESISQRWILDRTFEPRMSADERESIYTGWQDAVAAARSLPNRG
ncbi:MAG: NAD-dependent epimerase/dehydratase family protein, partial [Microbacteriaceae bacterium]|nr:NAD-dependent epimerase/dehydratase family protein [Microbacteriaceae bacterium]